MRPENYELSNMGINVHLGITKYKNGVHLQMHAGVLPISGTLFVCLFIGVLGRSNYLGHYAPITHVRSLPRRIYDGEFHIL